MRRLGAFAICGVAAALLTGPADAGSLKLDPVKVEISAERKVGSIRIVNEAATPVTIRGHALKWTQADGKDVYADARDVIVSPPIFTIPPGGTQLVRLGLRGAPSSGNYRLIVEEAPVADAGGGVQVALRLDLPVYVLQKPGTVDELAWSAWQGRDGLWVLEATNSGSGYVRVESQEAVKRTGITLQAGLLGTVLPGATRRWTLGAEPAVADRAQFLRIARKAGDNAEMQLASKR